MATRRDQLQSYQFLLQRVVSALVYRTTDPANSPFRKAGGAVFAGVMLSILALTVTAVIQFFTGAWKQENWFDGGAIIMEEETGATYVVFPTDDQMSLLQQEFKNPPEQLLYPVANFASAALLAGTTQVIKVSQESLTGEGMGDKIPPRGMMVGIPGLPDSIPPADRLLEPGWAVCSVPSSDPKKEPGSLLMVGELAAGRAITNMADYQEVGEGLLVEDVRSGQVYLIWNGFKHELKDTTQGSTALEMSNPVPLAPAVIKAIPTGEPLAPPQIANVGDESSVLPGINIGQTFRQGDLFQVVLNDGVAPISELQAALLNLANGTATLEESTALQKANEDKKYVNEFLPVRSDSDMTARALPFRIPKAPSIDPNSASCINFAEAGAPTVFVSGVDVPDKIGVRTTKFSGDGNTYADRIAIVPGRAMLVQAGDGAGVIGLITPDGYMFPFSKMAPGTETGAQIAVGGKHGLESFGYEAKDAVPLPPEIESLIPRGHELNPGKVALTTVAGSYTEKDNADAE